MFGFDKGKQDNMQKRMMDKEIGFNREQDAVNIGAQGDEIFLEHKKENEDLTRWQQDLENEITLTVHDLRREYQNEDGNWEPKLLFTGDYEEDKNGKKHPVF